MKTVSQLRVASGHALCYSDEQIQAFIDRRDAVGWTDALLEIPPADACYALAGWLDFARRVEWSQAAAQRARVYADAADAANASYSADAADAANYAAADSAKAAEAAADAANYAADAAYYAADAASYKSEAAEHHISVRHGAMLLEQQLKGKE